MNVKKCIQTEELFRTLRQIRIHNINKEYVLALGLIEKALVSEALLESGDPSNAKIHFLFAKAYALHYTDRPQEAFLILAQLVTDYPGTPEFEGYLYEVCSVLENKAKELILKNPEDPQIQSIFWILENYSVPPYWLTHAIAAQEAADGKVEQAWKRIENFLALSPNDHDYLRCALSLAKPCGKINEEKRLRAYIKTLLEERPYLIQLAPLLAGEEANEQLLKTDS